MADARQLDEEQAAWRDELQKRLGEFDLAADYADRKKKLDELRDLALKLHKSLAEAGHGPRHHHYMIENRGCQPTDPEFYRNIHAVQDLLKFTRDPHANDDPQDQTLGQEFELRVFSRRWKHEDTYRLKRTESGWYLSTMSLAQTGDCDKSARPHLFDALAHDSVQYPRGTGDWIEWLWDQAKQKGLSREQIQAGFDEVAEWINETERNAPCAGIWEGLTCPM